MNYILFFCDAVVILLSSYLLLYTTRIREDSIDLALSVFLLSCAFILGSSFLLSELRSISPIPYILVHLSILALSFLYFKKRKPVNIRKANNFSFKQKIYNFLNETDKDQRKVSGMLLAKSLFIENPCITFFAVVVILLLIVELATVIFIVPNNWDSMTYHLSRVGYWAQFETLRHYFTINTRQNVYPINGEVLLLWAYAFLKSDVAFGLLEFISMLFTSLLIYKTSLLISMKKKQALFSALFFITLPALIIESTTTQNNIVITFFVFLAVYFLMVGLKKNSGEYILISSISTGIALGTKATFFLAAPGVAVSLLYYYAKGIKKGKTFLHYKGDKELLIKWLCYSLLFMLLLGSYNYVLNFVNSNSFFGGKDSHAISEYSLDAFLANLSRIMYKFIDMSGWPNTCSPHTYMKDTGKIFKALFDLFGIKYNMAEATSPGVKFSFSINKRCNADYSYFGIMGVLVILPTLFSSLAKFKKHKQFKAWLTIIATLIFVSFCVLLKFNRWNGRFFIMAVAFLAPLSGSFYYSGKNIARRLYKVAIIGVIPILVLNCVRYNEQKPLPWGFLDSNLKMRCKMKTDIYEVFKFVEDNVGENSDIGVMMGGDDWDFPLFNGKRKVFQVKRPEDVPTQVEVILAKVEKVSKVLPNMWKYKKINSEWVLLEKQKP